MCMSRIDVCVYLFVCNACMYVQTLCEIPWISHADQTSIEHSSPSVVSCGLSGWPMQIHAIPTMKAFSQLVGGIHLSKGIFADKRFSGFSPENLSRAKKANVSSDLHTLFVGRCLRQLFLTSTVCTNTAILKYRFLVSQWISVQRKFSKPDQPWFLPGFSSVNVKCAIRKLWLLPCVRPFTRFNCKSSSRIVEVAALGKQSSSEVCLSELRWSLAESLWTGMEHMEPFVMFLLLRGRSLVEDPSL